MPRCAWNRLQGMVAVPVRRVIERGVRPQLLRSPRVTATTRAVSGYDNLADRLAPRGRECTLHALESSATAELHHVCSGPENQRKPGAIVFKMLQNRRVRANFASHSQAEIDTKAMQIGALINCAGGRRVGPRHKSKSDRRMRRIGTRTRRFERQQSELRPWKQGISQSQENDSTVLLGGPWAPRTDVGPSNEFGSARPHLSPVRSPYTLCEIPFIRLPTFTRTGASP